MRPCDQCRLGRVDVMQIPLCTVNSLWKCLQYCISIDTNGLVSWAEHEDGLAYLSLYLCMIFLVLTGFKRCGL